MTAWEAVFVDPPSGEELAVGAFIACSVTDNFEGVSATIEISGERAELSFVTELRTDLLLYSDKVLAYRMKVMDAEDTFTVDGHTVILTCQSYEAILARRLLWEDYESPGATEQHEIAWQLVAYTQSLQTLGITKASDWAASGTNQDRVIKKGKTIAEAINEVATVGDGFDWWIDQNLKMHAQSPRLSYDTGLDLIWGARVQAMTRSSASDLYASAVMVTGAEAETVIGSTTYPPPAVSIRQLTTRPLGRWEASYTYPELVTNASVVAKADWHLADSAKRRNTYRVELTPGVWTQAIRPGGLVSLRARSLPRVDFRVQCRVEEVGIVIKPDGGEDVTLALRGETEETLITTTPSQTPTTPISSTSPPGAVNVTVTGPTGRTVTVARTSSVNVLVALIKSVIPRRKQ